ncbi:SRPBCC family protein [Kutzneria viridogrisea]|uniref:SRPBCC family protein n=2 Tax=Kutzneria TaxID=43356 RepID=W5WKY9_9PSEU|nr:SRPBCC family protein [Kutzneria albida]AHI01436.1 hypothetical protein KALB_8078 [Kutzneria albida DSM 43870]MBA8931396.1 uncharacterized protein YndB with AHSA1/START domain [Kutzneria viridogrisea]
MSADSAVTGAGVELSLLVDLPPERLWELVTDVPGYGRWSPECEHTAWLGGATGRVGDRFAGRNRFGGGFVTSVVSVVTELSRPEVFAWVVLDGSGEVDRPGSVWRYELAPGAGAGQTSLRHSFVHGPGETGLRVLARQDPAALDRRLAELRHNMAASLAAMLDGERYREVPR